MLITALLSMTAGALMLGAAVVARHRAQAAADLAALAGAGRLPGGPDLACREAQAVAAAMRSALQACEVDRLDVVVRVWVEPGRIGGRAAASARAGPAALG
ncbi:MAG: helicase [Mycobacteriaceae bacterium]|nr:helicase [Mycobacteriaceae bacterium]